MTNLFFLFTILVHFAAGILGFWALQYNQARVWYTLAYLTMAACMTFGFVHLDIWFQSNIEIPTFRESVAYLIHGVTALVFHMHLIRKGSALG